MDDVLHCVRGVQVRRVDGDICRGREFLGVKKNVVVEWEEFLTLYLAG